MLFRLLLITLFSFVVVITVKAQTTVVSYDFNASNQGWTASNGNFTRDNNAFGGASGNNWNISPYNNYSNNIFTIVTSPTIDLSSYYDVSFSMDVRYKTEAAWDGMLVQYSTDGGASWTILGNVGEGVNWYNDTDVDALGNNIDGWSGNNGAWQTATIDITEVSFKNNVRFRVVFASDGSQTDDGAAFDNVVISGNQVTFAASDGTSPGAVSNNLSIWLKADEEVKRNGNSVHAWGDRTVNANHAYQAETTDRPQYIDNALNGNPVVYFEEGPFLDGNAGFYTQQYFIVLDPNEIYNNTNAVGRIMGFQPGGFGNLSFGPSTVFSDEEIITHAINGTGYRVVQEDISSNYGNPSLIVSNNNTQASPTEQWLYNNGARADTRQIDVGSFSNLSNQGYRLGDVFDANVYSPFNGRIAEMISYSSRLSDAERRDVETYLAIKYGITLDISTQDYTVGGVSIYGNTSYANDITGIGRNSATQSLNQTSSKSVNQGSIIRMNNASGLDDGDYIVWGNDGAAVDFAQTFVPPGNTDRFEKTWFVEETGDVGTVDVSITISQLGIDLNNSTLNLLVANAGSTIPNDFSTGTVYTSGTLSTVDGQTVLTFSGIDFNDGDYFTICGAVQTTSPGGIKDDLSMWFRADAGVSMSGSDVTRWADYSGNANDVYQGNTSKQPSIINDEINFNPSIDFNNDYLDGIDGFYSNDFFVVLKPDAILDDANNVGGVLGFESGTFSSVFLGPGIGTYANEVATFIVDDAGGTYSSAVNSTTEEYNSPLILNSKQNAAITSQDIFINGILKSNAETKPAGLPVASDSELRVGDIFSGFSYNGQIAEIISYSSRLSDAERRDVETYLAIKYGVTLDISLQSYTALGSNIYNYTTHSNNIVGVARDLDNGFDQARSVSSNVGAVVELEVPTMFDNGDYIVVGKDGASNTTVQTSELPTVYDARIAAEYRAAVTGTPTAIDVKFYIGGIDEYADRPKTASFYTLLTNTTGDFTSVDQAYSGVSLVNDTIIFENVSFSNGDYFTLSVPVAPEIGENNTLWLRADKGVSTSGSEITSWEDQSGEGNDASPAGTGPTLVNDLLNGNPGATMAGNTIQGTAGFYTQDYFVVISPDATYSSASASGAILGFEGGGQPSGLILGSITSALANEVVTHVIRGAADYRSALTSTTVSFSDPTIINSGNNAATNNQLIYEKGLRIDNATANTFRNLANQAYILGHNYQGTGAFNGKITEVLSFSTRQTDVERRNVNSYLALKYGMTLDAASGNYTIGGTTIYDITTFAGYLSDVVGVGVYAGYDLNQTISQSINSTGILEIAGGSGLNNNDFLVIGHDGGSLAEISTGTPTDVADRVTRKWAVQTTNTPGTVTLTFDLAGQGYGSKTVSDFSLILDTDSDFENGIDQLVTASSFAGEILTFNAVDLSAVNYIGIGSSIDLTVDTDTDGIPNYFEIAYGTDPNDGDDPVVGGSPYTDTNATTGVNNDGISDALEFILISNGATGPVSRYTDTDGDDIPDWVEVENGTSPYDANVPDANGDTDSDADGFADALEAYINAQGGAANSGFTTDTDGDGVPDFLEIINKTDPADVNDPVAAGGTDSDGDGISDALENILQAGGVTGAIDKSTDFDGDGIPEYIEAITHTDPFNIASPTIPTSLDIRVLTADYTVSGGSCIDVSGYQWINVTDNNGRIVFSICPVGNDLGSTCWGVRILSGAGAIRDDGEKIILNRNWWINPTTQPTGENVYIRFYGINQEATDLYDRAVADGVVTGISNDEFNTSEIVFTKIESINSLDPLVTSGNRTLHYPTVLDFGATGLVFGIGIESFSSFVAHANIDDSPLPISLLYFNADLNESGQVALDWATASEKNNDFFTIERSLDGDSFEAIGRVDGAGDSNIELQYNFIDRNAYPGVSYYRLRQVDFDGAYTFSPIQTINQHQALDDFVAVYPIPTEDRLTIQLLFQSDVADPKVIVSDMTGKVIISQYEKTGAATYQLDVSQLKKGVYNVKISVGDNLIVRQFVKN